MADFTETSGTSTATWTQAGDTTSTWAHGNVDVVKRYGKRRYGVGRYGQGFILGSKPSFTEIDNG